MKPRFVAFVLVAAAFGLLRADLEACGDKSLSAGGIRTMRGRAEKFPASILIYAKPNSTVVAAARELKLQQTLTLVGHTYREVTSQSELQAALASGRFNIVMADAAESTALQQELKDKNLKAVVIPVAYKPTRAEEKAAKQLKFFMKAPSRAAVYLDTITDAVRAGNTPN